MVLPTEPRVSVAVCTYNGEQFLGEQLRSILTGTAGTAGTAGIAELVLSDDASSDETIVVAEAAVAEFGPAGLDFKLLRNERPLGVTKNFEQAIAACTGELIVLSDQDDRWHPERLEVALEHFASRPELTLLHSDAALVDATGQPLGLTLFEALEVSARERAEVHSGRAFGALLRRNLVTGATTGFRRALLETALPFPAEWVHDEWLGAVAAATGEVDLIESPLIDYRQHGGNQIGARRRTLRDSADRLRESRGDRIRQLIARSEVLRVRLAADPRTRPGVVAQLDAKLEHLQRRVALPAARTLRLPGILSGYVSGRYSRYGRGSYDVIRDLVQPGV